jgi:hypothetical protein
MCCVERALKAFSFYLLVVDSHVAVVAVSHTQLGFVLFLYFVEMVNSGFFIRIFSLSTLALSLFTKCTLSCWGSLLYAAGCSYFAIFGVFMEWFIVLLWYTLEVLAIVKSGFGTCFHLQLGFGVYT